MQWVKFHISLLDNDAWKRLAPDARLTFVVALALAGKQRQDGALAIRGVGPMSVAEIASYTGLTLPRQRVALDALVGVAFIARRVDGAYLIERWSEKAGDNSTERVRKHRSKVSETQMELHETVSGAFPKQTEEELEKELDTLPPVGEKRARKSDAWEFGIWLLERGRESGLVPSHVLDLAGVAYRDLDAAERLLQTYGREKCESVALLFISSTAERRERGEPVKAFGMRALADLWDLLDRPKSERDMAADRALEALR